MSQLWYVWGMIFVWFLVEFAVKNRTARVTLQFVMVFIVASVSFSLGQFLGGFGPTLQGNSQLKNLTQGLISILDQESLDHQLLQENLQQLDDQVLPIYESYSSSQQGLKEFLGFYGIDYQEEFKPEIE